MSVSSLQRVPDAQITVQAYEAHVHYRGRAGEDVARYVYNAPGLAEGPVAP